ncbi:MAG: UDP-3-O-(3-hydroxymyristoyl)glucosamine N-acyltransferase [Candidatus Firestonebacteria bacterium]
MTLKEIADLVKGELKGEGHIRIDSVAELGEAVEGQIAFVSEEKHLEEAAASKASAFIIKSGLELPGKNTIAVPNAHFVIAKVIERLSPKPSYPKGVHHSAVVGRGARIGKDVSIMPFAVIEDGAEIGKNTVIFPFSYVGKDVKIGENCLIYQQVVIRERVKIGNNVIIHCGAIIGADGFGYTKLEDGTYYKLPHVGNVIIEDDVDIGANTTIDRAMLSRTVIKKGAKIDNLVQIGHNVTIGENCIIAAQSGVAGSAKMMKGSILAGQVGLADHVTVGENTVVLAQSGVSKDIPDNKVYWGYPADEVKAAWKALAEVRRLPSLIEKIKNIEILLEELAKKLSK